MVQSPFIAATNLYQITFQVSDGTVSQDEFGSSNTNLVSKAVTCYLRQDKSNQDDPRIEEVGASRLNLIKVSGRAADPLTLPKEIKPGITAEASIDGKTYTFYLISRYADDPWGVASILGEKIEGMLSYSTVAGS